MGISKNCGLDFGRHQIQAFDKNSPHFNGRITGLSLKRRGSELVESGWSRLSGY